MDVWMEENEILLAEVMASTSATEVIQWASTAEVMASTTNVIQRASTTEVIP